MDRAATVLVVDDEPVNLGLLFEHLRAAGLKILVAQTGEAALQIVERFQPDLILLDIILPDMDGFELYRQLKDKNKEPDIPVIFLSALTDTETKVRALESDAVDYITKPFAPQEIIARVKRHLLIRDLQRQLREKNALLEHEIEDRGRMGDSLRQSEEKYRRLFETLIDVYYQVDPEGKVILVSPSITKAAGYTCEEVIGSNVRDYYVDPEERDRFLEVLMKQGLVDDYEVQMRKKDGSVLWVSFNARMNLDKAGNFLGIEGFARDITERKRGQQAIIRAKEEWERTFDSVRDLIAVLDDRHRIVRLNKAMADRLGIRPEEGVGLTCYEHVHGTPCPPEYCPHTQLMADGQERTVEIYEERLGGDFLVSVSPLHDTQGRLMGSVHLARDITERKRAEEALKKAYEELEGRVEERTLELMAKTQHLEEVNTALKVLLKQRQEDKTEFEEAIMNNIKSVIVPYMERLKRSRLDSNQATYLAILESNIGEITSTFVRNLSLRHLNLTPSEMQVAVLVKEGKMTKEIAEILCISEKAISFHRHNIRRKLGLKKSKRNLRSYLASLL